MPEGSPLSRFAELFARRRAERRLALLPYLMAGYPSPAATVDLIEALVEAGADGFELGVPFSDPIADGPTVQRAGQVALDGGMTPPIALDLLRQARARGVRVPVALMTYANPVVHYGVARYCRDAAAAGADGLIVPDLPPDEAADMRDASRDAGLALITFVAPTTPPARLMAVARAATGFIYVVSLTGVTGARSDLAVGLEDLLARVRAVTTTPLVVGFGISRPEHVAFLIGRADGAIVGAALIDAIERGGARPLDGACEFIRGLRAGADSSAAAAQ